MSANTGEKAATSPVEDPICDNEHGRQPETGSTSSEVGDISRQRRRWPALAVLFVHITVWVVMTGWWIAGLILHRYDIGWLIPFLVWLGLSIRLLTLHVPTKLLTKPIAHVWDESIATRLNRIPRVAKLGILSFLTLGAVLAGTFAPGESASNTRADRAVSLFGLVVFLGGFWAASKNRAKINWQAVITGILMQFLLGLFVLRTRAGYDIFNFLGSLASDLLDFSGDGAVFLTSETALASGWFIVSVVPAIIFFVSLVHLLHYWGWLQWLIGKLATFFFSLMGISGAEATVAAASPFLGQSESPVLVRAFLPLLTRAELHQIMTSGFATIAGSVLSGYIALGVSPPALVASCAMSIPASIAISKLRYPETEEEPLGRGRHVGVVEDDDGNGRPFNSLHALANGSWAGIKIAGMVVASVLCILALLGLVNGLLGWWGRYLNIDHLSIQLIVGYIFYPIAFLLGVERNGDLLKVAQLIGVKIVSNEFVAFGELTKNAAYDSLSPRSRLIATHALCGFGNISSVGIQIGILSQLSPGRSGDVSKVAVSALISGIFSTLTSAAIAGMLVVN